MGMGEEMDRTYIASPPAVKSPAQRLADDLHWFDQEFDREFPLQVGTAYKTLARYWFCQGLARAAEFEESALADIRMQVAQAMAKLKEIQG